MGKSRVGHGGLSGGSGGWRVRELEVWGEGVEGARG